MANIENRVVSTQKFYGGQSSDVSIGPAASFAYSRALEFRRDPSKLTVLPGPRKISAGVVNDLILNIVQVQNGNRYAYGEQGNIYKINTSNVVTYFDKLPSGSDGEVYRQDSDAIFFATNNDIRRAYPMSGTPTIDKVYGASKSIDTNAYRSGGGSTCPVLTTLDEGQACSFQPDIEPFYSIKVNVITKGTGNWTLTLHDGLNKVLGTSTILAANMTNGLVEFVFNAPVRALVKPNARTYHFHLHSTAGDGVIATAALADINTADFELWAYRLIEPANGFHPMTNFQQFICIGNERYLAVWEPLSDDDPPNNEFQRHRLTFPPGFEVCGLANTDEFLVIACEKRSTDGTKDFQEGKLFIWDGISQTYNQIIDVSGGSPEGIFAYENYPYFFVNGALCAWPGGKNTIKIRTLADTDNAYSDTIDNTHCYPNVMAVRHNILHMGYPSTTTNVSLEHGVYTWGSLEKNYPASFGYSYVISTQTNLNTEGDLLIGCVRNFGDEMYIAWQDGEGKYGLDIVDSYCDPAPVAKFRAKEFDAGALYKEKQAYRVGVETSPLPEGVTLTPIYQLDDAAETSSEITLTEDGTSVLAPINMGTFKRASYGFDLEITGTESPTIHGVALEWNPLIGRKKL